MGKFILSILFMLAAAFPIPDGWQVPGDEYASEAWRACSESRYMEVTGDFNGDGLTDYTEILVSKDGRFFGVFAFMTRKEPEGFDVCTLVPSEDIKYLSFTGIEEVVPESYVTACGKGYWECSEGEPSKLDLSHDAINYFNYEGANSFFYWNEEIGGFRSVSISD